MPDKRQGRTYRTDRLERRDVRWRVAVGLVDSIDQLAEANGVSASEVAEDALALGLAERMVDDALAAVPGGMTTGRPARGHMVDTNGDR